MTSKDLFSEEMDIILDDSTQSLRFSLKFQIYISFKDMLKM